MQGKITLRKTAMESPNPTPGPGDRVKDEPAVNEADLGGATRTKCAAFEGCRALFRRACAGLDELPHVVSAKEMSPCDEFHSSLDELRRLAPSDQVGTSDTFRELLRHLDMIMLNIEGEGEAEHDNASDGAAQVEGTLSLYPGTRNLPSSNSDSLPDTTMVEVDGPVTRELSLFYEKQRLMDYTSCLIPEETNEMYDLGRMPELGCQGGGINQVGLLDEIAGEERFRDGVGGMFCQGTGNGYGPKVNVAEPPSSDQDGILGTLEADGEQTGMDANTTNLSTDGVEMKVEEDAPVTLPALRMKKHGDAVISGGVSRSHAVQPKAGNGYPGMDHVATNDDGPTNKGSGQCLESRGSDQKLSRKRGVATRKSNSRMPRLERGLVDAHRNISDQGVKEEVASEHEVASTQLRSKRRRCRVGGLAEDIKCEGTHRVPCNIYSGAGGVEVLTQDPKSTFKEMGTGSTGKQLQKGTRLRTPNRVAPASGTTSETRFWRPKIWSQDRRYNSRAAAEVPTTIMEFPASHSQRLEVATTCSSKQGRTSHQSHVSESSCHISFASPNHCILASPDFIIASHGGARWTYSGVVSSERGSVSSYAEVAIADKQGASDQHLQADRQADILVKLEGDRRCLSGSQEESKVIGGGGVYCELWQGLCSQRTKLSPPVRSKELPVAEEAIPCGISSPRPSFPRCSEGGLDCAIAPILFPETNQSSCYQGTSSFSHTKSDQELENVAATPSPHPVLPQQLPDESTTERFISNRCSRVLGNPRDQTKLNDRLQSHDSSQCAMALKICGSDLAGSQKTGGGGSFERQLLQWTSSQLSFEQAQYAIDHGLQNEHDFNGIRVIHILMSCVEALSSGEEGVGLAEVLLARLTDMVDIAGYPLQRVAAHFTTGLKLAFGIGMKSSCQASFSEAHLVGAYQVLHEVLPYIKFVHFTANQALLEAFEGKQEMHILDYDIMDGMQWPPLMHALAKARDRHQENSANNQVMTTPTKLRITAICRGQLPRNSISSSVSETGRRLEAFAKSLDLQFQFRAVQEPDVQLEEESEAPQERWQTLFRDLVDEQKFSPGKEILEARGGEGRNEAQRKPEMKETKASPGDQVSRGKSVHPERVTKTRRSSSDRNSAEWEMRAEPDQLENDSASDLVHEVTTLQSRADHESPSKQGQVQVNQKRISPAQQSGRRKGRARDRGIAPKFEGAKPVDEDVTDLKMLPLKPEVETRHSSQDVYLLEVESTTREENMKPSRRNKVARHIGKRNKRLETPALPPQRHAGEGFPTVKDVRLPAPRFTVRTQLLANNAQGTGDGDRNCSESLVNLGDDSVVRKENRSRRNDADTGVIDRREEKGIRIESEDGVSRRKEICGDNLVQKSELCATMNQVWKHAVQQQKEPESAVNTKRITEEELHVRSQGVGGGEKALNGGRAVNEWDGVVSGRREKTFQSCVRFSAQGCRRFEDGHEASNDRAPESSKVQHYYRRRRPSDTNRRIPAPEISRGASSKPIGKPAYGGTRRTIRKILTKSDNLAPVANQNEPEQKERNSNSGQSVGKEEISRGNRTNFFSAGIEKHSMNSSPDKCLAVNCMVHLPHMAHQETGSVNSFLAAAARFSPHILTVGEDGMSMPGTEDFVTYFCEGLYHFCAFSDSLEESLPGRELASAVVEQLFCAPRIKSMLQSAREHMKRQKPEHKENGADNRRTSPRRLGFHSLPFTAQNRYQGKLLLQHFPIGYEVLESERSDSDDTLLLAWKRRPIVAVSAWRS